MFKVKSEFRGEEYTVYAVKYFKNKLFSTRFLIYKDNKWQWVVADGYTPVK